MGPWWLTLEKLDRELSVLRAWHEQTSVLPGLQDAPTVALAGLAVREAAGAMARLSGAPRLYSADERQAIHRAWAALATARRAVSQADELVAQARCRHDRWGYPMPRPTAPRLPEA